MEFSHEWLHKVSTGKIRGASSTAGIAISFDVLVLDNRGRHG